MDTLDKFELDVTALQQLQATAEPAGDPGDAALERCWFTCLWTCGNTCAATTVGG